MLYGGKSDETLNNLRYIMYMHQLATAKTQPNPEKLPPTESAAKYHILRVHLQVVQWKSLMGIELNAKDWGWKIENDVLVPLATDLKAAPDDILNVINCKCTMEKKKPCSSQLCGCRKYGLRCVAACKHCCGTVCSNSVAEAVTNSLDPDNFEDYDIDIVTDDMEQGIELYEEIIDPAMEFADYPYDDEDEREVAEEEDSNDDFGSEAYDNVEDRDDSQDFVEEDEYGHDVINDCEPLEGIEIHEDVVDWL